MKKTPHAVHNRIAFKKCFLENICKYEQCNSCAVDYRFVFKYYTLCDIWKQNTFLNKHPEVKNWAIVEINVEKSCGWLLEQTYSLNRILDDVSKLLRRVLYKDPVQKYFNWNYKYRKSTWYLWSEVQLKMKSFHSMQQIRSSVFISANFNLFVHYNLMTTYCKLRLYLLCNFYKKHICCWRITYPFLGIKLTLSKKLKLY